MNDKYGLPSLPQTLGVIETMGLFYTIYNNDPLIAWASWILLHQTNMGRFDLNKVNYLLNQAYDVEEDHKMSYRKMIDVFKENPEKSMSAFNAIETGVGLAHNYYNLAVAYHQINQIDVAIKCFEKVVNLEPQNAPAYNNLGGTVFSKRVS